MAGKRSSPGAVRRGVPVAAALSGGFLVMLLFTPPVVAAAVAVAASVVVGVIRTRAVPRATADCLAEHTFTPTATIRAPKAAVSAGSGFSAGPSTGDPTAA